MKTGVHAIIQKIHDDAEAHGSRLYARTKESADTETESENAFYQADFSRRREILKKHGTQELVRLNGHLASRLKRELLAYQHSLIDEIFDMAALKLRNASAKEFSDMFLGAVAGLCGKFFLYLGERSKGKLEEESPERAMRENPGLEITLMEETLPDKSGFILTNDNVEYNCLFEDLIEDKKSGQSAAILKEVFDTIESLPFN